MQNTLHRAVDFLLRWQVGVETHVEDFYTDQTGWTKRPCFAWMAGAFPGDWFRNGPHDENGNAWRMGVGNTWHTGQTLIALVRAARHVDSPRLRRAVAQGASFITRMRILDGAHAGAIWTPPHSLPPQWRAQTQDAPLYKMPGGYVPAGAQIVNSDMCETIGGLLEASQFLNDPVALDAARAWGEWQYREGDIPPGDDQYHQVDMDTGEKGHVRNFGGKGAQTNRLWTMDDGIQGLLGIAFNEPSWVERYLLKVNAFIARKFDIKEMPNQQGRSFYWDSSLLHPVLQRKVEGPFDRAVDKFTEYVEGVLNLRGDDGMIAQKFDDDGNANFTTAMHCGDGAATAMAARMCWILYQATDDKRFRDEAQPMLQWIVDNQFPQDAPDRMAGGMPFCKWLRLGADKPKFDFTRTVATSFAVMTLSEWLEA